ncbi:MAG: hypothetical protein ACREYC_07280 [Gammaproteobacteria bacterium]
MNDRLIRRLARSLIGALALAASTAHAQEAPAPAPAPAPKPAVLITNARIFDGKSDRLTGPKSVLIEGNKITRIRRVDRCARGRHRHRCRRAHDVARLHGCAFASHDDHVVWRRCGHRPVVPRDQRRGHGQDLPVAWLHDGPRCGGQQLLDQEGVRQGHVPGTARVSIRAADLAERRTCRPPQLGEPSRLIGGAQDQFVQFGDQLVVDGVPEMLEGARDALRRGSSQIKIAVGGGSGSEHDPLDVVQFTPEEVRAAVSAASKPMSWRMSTTRKASAWRSRTG